MGILTEDMKRVVREQRLGFVATVCPDGTPNLSPKGTTAVWDDNHLVFAEIRSPGTLANLRTNPAMEINVVDPVIRKGYRFKGTAQVLTDGPVFDQIISGYQSGDTRRGTVHDLGKRIRSVVVMTVERAAPLVSPAYDTGLSEEEVGGAWERYWETIRQSRAVEGRAR
ncbi:MAG TPA: pyridoxamine 5'-phosphate oxidase family protein [bacterium]|nr:pyridoxamine 5'-phosphate oxidase family protein [bacterium]